MFLDTLAVVEAMWLSHERCSLIVTCRNLKKATCSIGVFWSSTTRVGGFLRNEWRSIYLFFFVNKVEVGS